MVKVGKKYRAGVRLSVAAVGTTYASRAWCPKTDALFAASFASSPTMMMFCGDLDRVEKAVRCTICLLLYDTSNIIFRVEIILLIVSPLLLARVH